MTIVTTFNTVIESHFLFCDSSIGFFVVTFMTIVTTFNAVIESQKPLFLKFETLELRFV